MKLPSILLSLVAAVVVTFGLSNSTAQAQGNCAGDNNSDGLVDGADLAIVLGAWGVCPGNCAGDNNGDGLVNGADLAIVLGAWGVCPSTITSVTPLQGSILGGTAITITGINLNGATSVKIGGVAATNVVAVNSTTVTAVTPAGSVGPASVEVTGAQGTATATNAFTYVVPTVWYTVLEQNVNAAVVTNANLRAAIIASGLPWRVRDTASNIEMLLVPAGTFTMGCSASTSIDGFCGSDESPTHQVTLSAFYMGRYEVTQAQWLAEMGSNPSGFVGYPDSPSRPVEQVSWNIIQPFCTQNGIRLPTEAEWEYAYRAGTTTAFHSYPAQPTGFNNDTLLGNIAWYGSSSGYQTHAVGGKFANALGLHDMSGNLWEWCQDWYGAYSSGAQTNPTGPATGLYPLIRGGSWINFTDKCRSSRRLYDMPGTISSTLGFRAARTP